MTEWTAALEANIDLDVLTGLGLAVVLGLLVGVQRGWALRNEAPGARFAGIRTFTLLGLAGALTGIVERIDPRLAAIGAAAVALLVLIGYAKSARAPDQLSGTASLVALLTFGCGFLAVSGQMPVATIIAVAMTIILAMRTRLHDWVEGLTETEINAIVRFALISIAILPLLPDRSYGPYQAWNPRQLWLVVVFVSGFSFIGYLAAKRFGAARAALATAAAGAMVSSTAVTAMLAARLRDPGENVPMLTAGVATASAVMLIRALCLVAVLAPAALVALGSMVGPAALVSALAAVRAVRAARRTDASQIAPLALQNPFRLLPAIGLMALVMLLTWLARWMMDRIGEAGVAAVLALSGLADVDSAIIAMGNLPPGTLDGRTAGLVLAAPIFANTLFKAGVALSIAGPRAGWRIAWPLVASVAGGLTFLPLLLP